MYGEMTRISPIFVLSFAPVFYGGIGIGGEMINIEGKSFSRTHSTTSAASLAALFHRSKRLCE